MTTNQQQRDRLIRDHFWWARSIAREKSASGEGMQTPWEDLLSGALFGLVEAGNSFDPRKGAFKPHALTWIEKWIAEGRIEGVRSEHLRMPRDIAEKISASIREARKSTGDPPERSVTTFEPLSSPRPDDDDTRDGRDKINGGTDSNFLVENASAPNADPAELLVGNTRPATSTRYDDEESHWGALAEAYHDRLLSGSMSGTIPVPSRAEVYDAIGLRASLSGLFDANPANTQRQREAIEQHRLLVQTFLWDGDPHKLRKAWLARDLTQLIIRLRSKPLSSVQLADVFGISGEATRKRLSRACSWLSEESRSPVTPDTLPPLVRHYLGVLETRRRALRAQDQPRRAAS